MGKRKSKNSKIRQLIMWLIVIAIVMICGYFNIDIAQYVTGSNNNQAVSSNTQISFDLNSIPEYNNKPYVIINNNIPDFPEEDYTKKAFETYSELDSLGRCGVAYANICTQIMPKKGETRGEISAIQPSGWKTLRFDGLVDGNYLYNRCHLIGWQLAGENANPKNLITGTRYMNVEGMLPFENMVDDYIEENTKNHVLYRVTPIFEGDNLVASGVQMEAYSVEDNGKGIKFNVYVYNVQPEITINYKTGEAKLK